MRSIARIAAFVLMLPTVVAAQPWRELYDRGEYEKAAALLYPLWMDRLGDPVHFFPDIEVTETLGRLHLEGRGVPRDDVLACSFFELGVSTAIFRHHDERHPVAVRMMRLRDDVCGKLSAEGRKEAMEMTGCPKFGPDAETFPLDGVRQVRIDRHMIRLEYGEHQHSTPHPLPCGSRVALVRHTRLEAPAPGPLTKRDFLQVFVWIAVTASQQRQRALAWGLFEVTRDAVEMRGGAELGQQPGSTWMNAAIPPEWTIVSFHRKKDGDIDWQFTGLPANGTVPALRVEIAPETAEDPPPLARTGNARVAVLVVDRDGAALAGASVKLEGVVRREAQTDERGNAAFDRLPHGRYDVTAWMKGLAASGPRVLDLSGPEGQATLTLKPHGSARVGPISCGGLDAASIEALAAKADLVLHVKVESQRAFERQHYPSDGGAPGHPEIMTAHHVRVLRSFKGSAGSATTPTISIVQPGGSIDRGDSVDTHIAHRFDPLNVGDEYVVFLRKDQGGDLLIHQFAEGAFRLRNGRVDPLGAHRIAEAWKGRSADRFFDALRDRVGRSLARPGR